MMDEGDRQKIDEQFLRLDAQARKRRHSSVAVTLLLVSLTALLVLRLARDIVEKQAEVKRVEQSRGELNQQLRSEQEKLDAAAAARKELEAEVKQLEATKKSYQGRILSEKEAHNGGASQGAGQGVSSPPHATAADDPPAAEAILIEETGKAPPGFVITPKLTVTPARGASGREIFKVHLWLEVPEAQRGDVERATYHLSPKFYLKNVIDAGGAPSFEAKFNVFACESTVLGRVRLHDGTTLAFDFDWCRHEGWPDRKKETVFLVSEDEKTPLTAPLPPPRAPTSPSTGIATPPKTHRPPTPLSP